MIRTPTLREQLADTPEDLRNLLRIVAGRIAHRRPPIQAAHSTGGTEPCPRAACEAGPVCVARA